MLSGSPKRKTVTLDLYPAKCRAITKPSPPLFPSPAKTRTFFDLTSPNFSSSLFAHAAPAFSIINFLENPI